MDLALQNRTILVTGGSRGIGLACARGFLAEGARVAIVGRSAESIDAARAALGQPGLCGVVADLSQPGVAPGVVAQVEAELGPIDVLVNCAGAAQRTPAAELTEAHWQAAMQAKFFPYVHAMAAVLPGMCARRSGVIVNVVGQGGKQASPTHLPGGSANAALMLASAGLAQAHAAQGVRVLVVNPGLTRTDRLEAGLLAEARAAGEPIEAVQARRLAGLPMGRAAEPEEVADVVVFAASGRASYLSGAVIALDGAAIASVV
ncbi:MAG TPA: SDR family NAD(P)-dependent oxidoreductase [Burkholderiaceae bacterium]|nr:SDR family NAD(P)-dependent oxidoreductase [Burkholderiaceae bacterium]HNB44754.1 SDR family NAD(P)-dependent oxidoreductase [Burkholderiaceae bacterium]